MLEVEKTRMALDGIEEALKRIAVILENIFDKDSFNGKGHINITIEVKEKSNGK